MCILMVKALILGVIIGISICGVKEHKMLLYILLAVTLSISVVTNFLMFKDYFKK